MVLNRSLMSIYVESYRKTIPLIVLYLLHPIYVFQHILKRDSRVRLIFSTFVNNSTQISRTLLMV